MRGADAFEDVAFLGLAKRSKRDSLRLALFAEHLADGERPLALLAIHGGTLVVTDRRLIEFRAHLEVHGAWNVKEFRGYEIRRQIERAAVRGLEHHVSPRVTAPGDNVEDALVVRTEDRVETIVVSKGPEGVLCPEDLETLREAILGQAK